MTFDDLGQLREAMREFTTGFDPALVTATRAKALLGEAAAIKKMAAALEAKLAARVAETDAWRGGGERSPAEFLAKQTGTSVGQAIDQLKTAERLKELPAVDAAARRGELSPQQASAIAGAASANPAAEEELVDAARELPLKELQKRCAEKRAEVEDAEARRKRIHDRRFVRESHDAEGGWHLHAHDNPEVGAAIMAVLNALRDALFAKARAEGRREPSEAYAMDALAQLLLGPGHAGVTAEGHGEDDTAPAPARPRPSYKVVIGIDLMALLRGYAVAGERCDIAGCPVAVSAVEEILASGQAFVAAVIRHGDKLTGVAHLGRAPTARQQTALEWLYPSCAVAGCSQVARLQRDHRVDWARTHVTVLDLLDLLCAHHHGLKTREHWALVEGRGKRAFVPPDDPRHPENQHAPPGEAA
jgi:hypothetical protein